MMKLHEGTFSPCKEIRMKTNRWISIAAALVLVALLIVGCSQNVPVEPEASLSAAPPDRYIVVLHDHLAPGNSAANKARAARIANEYGVGVRHAYGTALFGFSGVVPAGRLEALRRDPRVAWVEPEAVHELAATQTIPTGIARIDVPRNPKVSTSGSGTSVRQDIAVAVLDSGIAQHPDLNVIGGRNFANGGATNWGDGNGHGTHVAGTIGARDNGTGVVGVAPGVPLWSVRVCGNSGFCMSGDIVAGIDWVAQQKVAGAPFVAANFSISSADSSNSCDSPANATHQAICRLVGTGVVFVMSAGNEGRLKVPYPVTLSVSALADFDGKPGRLFDGTSCRVDQDDSLANFSNYGPDVDIAAPGVCILSTWNDGGYRTISGTSMSAPHVTGAVALYVHANESDVPTTAEGAKDIKDSIVGAAHPQGPDNPCSYVDTRVGGPLLFVNAVVFGGDGTCAADGGGDDSTGGDTGGGGTGGGDTGGGGGGGGEEPPPPGDAGPTASFTYQCNTTSTCTFTDASIDGSAAIQTWSWAFENGTPGAAVGQLVSSDFPAGSHQVVLTVTDANDASSVVTRSISCSSHPRHGIRCK
jgi:subtilisin